MTSDVYKCSSGFSFDIVHMRVVLGHTLPSLIYIGCIHGGNFYEISYMAFLTDFLNLQVCADSTMPCQISHIPGMRPREYRWL